MPAREIDTIINFICRIVLLLMEGIHLFIILCTYACRALIHVHGRLLQLVISTTRATYQPIAVHEIHFHINPEGNVGYHLDCTHSSHQLHPCRKHLTSPPRHLAHTPLLSSRTTSSHLSLCNALRRLLHPLVGTPSTVFMNVSNNSTTATTLTTLPLANPLLPPPIVIIMANLLELINNLTLNIDSPKDTSPKPANTSSPPFTFDPNPSDMLDIPPPPSPNPFQPPGPDYGWGNK
ncbi:hypothetical protein JAAARDRAFT_190104 [Jaapia argillacea MUCL 33604]|uniref:Uncharacterized protein n=1 Tax=Jaapia argillacea MUCL 33604 TaxID=933084 RepID=A0A067Q762_9AGAM|nr:hypothetical protein JAAARDRAFT_190104 [Jaapia argillacea MUCL 33604]